MSKGIDLKERYKTYLRLERGLSPNSIDAYLTDVDKLFRFANEEGKPVTEITYDDLRQFIAQLCDIGIHPRSQARILSGIKSFYGFLMLEEYITADPTELIESPKIGLRLPEVLTVEEIDRIIGVIDLSQPEGHRNRAMLEVLYSCGLRVSELVNLRYADIYPKEGFIRVLGKGSKQRLVPISAIALHEINNYLMDRNKIVPKKGFEDILFLNRRAEPQGHLTLTRHGLLHHQGSGGLSRHTKEGQPTHLPSLFRHALIGRRRQSPGDPGDARARENHDNRDLDVGDHSPIRALPVPIDRPFLFEPFTVFHLGIRHELLDPLLITHLANQ